MALPPPLNLANWIDRHRDDLSPPAGAKTIWTDTDFIVTVVGGPNDRADYHENSLEEFFFQLKGDMTLRVIDDGERKDIPIREGEIFLLPPHVLHSPQRRANTVGLIVERARPRGVIDAFEWFCDACHARVHRREVQVAGLEQGVNQVIEEYDANPELRACKACGHVNPGRDERN
jgi:3-hydroxyanthranilate 3,4-dioxygenase